MKCNPCYLCSGIITTHGSSLLSVGNVAVKWRDLRGWSAEMYDCTSGQEVFPLREIVQRDTVTSARTMCEIWRLMWGVVCAALFYCWWRCCAVIFLQVTVWSDHQQDNTNLQKVPQSFLFAPVCFPGGKHPLISHVVSKPQQFQGSWLQLCEHEKVMLSWTYRRCDACKVPCVMLCL